MTKSKNKTKVSNQEVDSLKLLVELIAVLLCDIWGYYLFILFWELSGI